MKQLLKNANTTFGGLYCMAVMNLLFMHYQFLFTIALESECFKTSIFDNIIACLLDTTIIFGILYLLTLKRLRISLIATFLITLIWSFCNTLYARFFSQYISLSAIGQAGNLADDFMINSMLAGIRAIDLYYPLFAGIFIFLLIKTKNRDISKGWQKILCIIWSAALFLGVSVHSLYAFHPEKTIETVLEKTILLSPRTDAMWPNWTVFHRGSLRTLFLDHLFISEKLKLTKEEKNEIEREYTDYRYRVTKRTAPDNIKNVIFILVESYLSVSSDLIVDGKEITPNLNRLKHDSTVYFNGHMQPNVSIGESSDGQLIYMAGLLPLHSEITVTKAKKIKVFGLPEQIKKQSPALKSYTLIPTNPTLWEQQGMTEAYGFDHLYSTLDYQADFEYNKKGDYLSDEKVFKYAALKDKSITSPFFSLILTFSMHQPYDTYEEHGFHLTDKNLPEKYRNYLTSCHYTDAQIGKYLDILRERGIYDNSLIVIVSDHDARPKYIDMDGIVPPEIPLYIINGGIDKTKVWNGVCNQLDVYTTILDILGIESKWRGLGHTLLNTNYQNSVTDKIQKISSNIINSDFFGTEKQN